MKRPWTLDEVDDLRELAAAGVPLHELPAIFNRSYASIEGVALRYGIVVLRARSKGDPNA